MDILPQTFKCPEGLDVIKAVEGSLALSWAEHMIEVWIDAPIEEVRENVPTNLLVLEELQGNKTRLRSSASSLEWFAWRLAQIPFPMTIIEPEELKSVMQKHAAHLNAIVAANPTT